MKRFFLTLCALCATTALWAATATVDGITWTYTVSDGKATIGTGNSSYPAIPNSASGLIAIPQTLGGYPVTSISNYAFYSRTGLTSVTIPSSVTSIGDRAFSSCSGLTSITIPDSVRAIANGTFGGCSNLTSVTIPSSVTSIGDYAFSGCSGLTSITIPDSVRAIAKGTFAGCTALKTLMIPSSVTSIEGDAFYNCSGLTSISIPSSVTSIEDSAFSRVAPTTLTAVKFPGGGMSKGNLRTVIIQKGITSIPVSAFSDCLKLTTLTIPSSITSIKSSAFSGCTALKNVIFEGEPPALGSDVFPSLSATITYKGEYAKKWDLQANSGSWGMFHFSSEDVPVYTTIIGSGTITTSAADGIVEYFPKGETRSLTATANEGYIFMGWSGDVVSLEPAITLTSEDVERYQLTALFLPKALIKAVAKEMIEEEKLTSDIDVETAVNTIISNKLSTGALVSAEGAKTEAGKVMDEKMEEKGVVTQNQIDQLALDTPVLGVQNGAATLSLKVKKATTLSGDEADWKELTFTEGDVALDANGLPTVTITPEEDEKTVFYKFVVPHESDDEE